MKMYHFRNNGFTMVEVLVVLAIIALLTSVVFASLSNARMKSRDASRIANAQQIVRAIEMGASESGSYALPGAGLGANPGNGFVSLDASASSTYGVTSIAGMLKTKGLLAADKVLDPIFGKNNYYVTNCTASSTYGVYLRVEDPKLALATSSLLTQCGGAEAVAAGMNYLVSASGVGIAQGVAGGEVVWIPPSGLVFSPLTGQQCAVATSSLPVQLTGILAGTPMSVTGGTFATSSNNITYGAYTSSSTVVNPGVWVKLRTTAPSPGTAVVDLNVAGAISSWSLSTTGTCSYAFNPYNKVDYTLLPATANPRDIVTADFNGDGKIDFATSNELGPGVSVFLNDGTGLFPSKGDYTTGAKPYSIAKGDFNADGKIDLATANYNDNTLSVLTNNGLGVFTTRAETITTPTSPSGLVAADMNNDGKLDLITSNYYGNNVSVFRGNGDATFAVKIDTNIGINPTSVTAVDIDRDGWMDLAATNNGAGPGLSTISVLINNRVGGFYTPVSYSTGNDPADIIAADFNGDLKPDLATADEQSHVASIFINNGTSTFNARFTQTAGGSNPRNLAAADLTGDGAPEIITTFLGANWNVAVSTNSGSGSFAAPGIISAANTPRAIGVGDFNGDGRPDLAVVNQVAHSVSVFINR